TRVGCSCGATAISRTRPRTVPEASRTVAPSSSDKATRDMHLGRRARPWLLLVYCNACRLWALGFWLSGGLGTHGSESIRAQSHRKPEARSREPVSLLF